MIQHFLPLVWTVGGIFVFSIAIYLAIRFLAYKRSFPLSHHFDFLWVVDTLMALVLGACAQPPFQSLISAGGFQWLGLATFLLSAYLLIFVVDQFLVEYFLCTVLKMNVSPPLRKMILMFVFVVAAVVAVQKIFNINPWAVYAPTSLISLGIGIALKDAFGTFFAGVALSRIVRMGDWIKVGDREGEVVDINWARTVLRTWEGQHLFIPNSELQKNAFTSFSYQSGRQRCRLDVGVSYDAPPQKIKKVLTHCAQNVEGVAHHPAPEVLLTAYADFAVQYALTFWVSEYSRWREISDEVATRVWYAFKRENIEIPYPIRTVRLVRKGHEESALAEPESVLSHIDLFKILSQDEQQLLCERFKRQTYIRGEVVVRQGEAGSSFYLVARGRVEVLRRTKDGKTVLVGELKPGQFFGELSLLTGEPRSATVRAASDAELLRLEKADFQDILARHPALAENMAEVVALRQSELAGIKEGPAEGGLPRKKSDLSSRIRKFFNLASEHHVFFAALLMAAWAVALSA